MRQAPGGVTRSIRRAPGRDRAGSVARIVSVRRLSFFEVAGS